MNFATLALVMLAITRLRRGGGIDEYGSLFTGVDFQTLLQAAGLVMVGGVLMDERNPLGDVTNTFKRRRLN